MHNYYSRRRAAAVAVIERCTRAQQELRSDVTTRVEPGEYTKYKKLCGIATVTRRARRDIVPVSLHGRTPAGRPRVEMDAVLNRRPNWKRPLAGPEHRRTDNIAKNQ